MDPVILGIVSAVALTLFLLSGVRIAFATALCGFLGLWMLRGYDPAAALAHTAERDSPLWRDRTRFAQQQRGLLPPIGHCAPS